MIPDPAWAYNAQRDKELKKMSLKSGWCLSNSHCVCPVKYSDPNTPACTCPCHIELDEDDLL